MNRVKLAWIDFAWEPREFIEASGNRVFTTVRGSGRD